MTGCGHVAGQATCGVEPTRRYLIGQRCSEHSPAALIGRPESVPDPDRTLAALRARAGVVDTPPLATSSLNDERAVASGKRRSSPNTYSAARDAETQRKAKARS